MKLSLTPIVSGKNYDHVEMQCYFHVIQVSMSKILKECYTLFLIVFTGLGMFVGNFLIPPLGKYSIEGYGIGGVIGFLFYNVMYFIIVVVVYPCPEDACGTEKERVEAHDEKEVETALRAGARVVGVNNRDLKTFAVDPANCLRLRSFVPPDVAFVAESGVKCRADVEALEKGGADAALVGEALMRAEDRLSALKEMRGKTSE